MQNLPVYLMAGAFLAFVIFITINSWQQEKKDKEAQNKDKMKEGKI